MPDDKETQVEQVAPVNDEAQAEQVATTEEVAQTPETVSDKVETKLYAGKFENPEELEKSYQESQSKLTQLAQENATLRQFGQQVPDTATASYDNVPQLDPDSALAVDRIIEEKWEAKRAAEFERKHADELKDPILSGTTSRLIKEANLRGEVVDQEEAFMQAKKMLDERVKPQIKQAQAQGVEQGEDIAKRKGQLGAVGESGPRPAVNPDEMSAKDFAKYYGLPYAD